MTRRAKAAFAVGLLAIGGLGALAEEWAPAREASSAHGAADQLEGYVGGAALLYVAIWFVTSRRFLCTVGRLLDRVVARLEQRASERAEQGAPGSQRIPAQRTVSAPRPHPRVIVQPVEAEHLAAEWMRHLGVVDAQVTRASCDGGIDVTSERFVAQVKHQSAPVAPMYVQQLYGIAQATGKMPVFFSLSGYSARSREFGAAHGVMLFTYDAVEGTLTGISGSARWALREGLARPTGV